jgi:rubrerythrin
MLNAIRSILSLLIPAAVGGTIAPHASATTTRENLQVAFQGESNANARYLAFAAKADEEGFGEVASLFRAAAKAEEIHANNHAFVIRRLGGVPIAQIAPTLPKTTKENLKAAIEAEKYERDVLYPEFIAVAHRQKATAALRSFTFALKVEAVHVVLYQVALDHLEISRGKQHTYHVCPDCGNTLAELTILRCVVCRHLKSGFLAIS